MPEKKAGNLLARTGERRRYASQLPKTLTLGPREHLFWPISTLSSRKASPSPSIFSRFISPKGFGRPDWAEKRCESILPNPLTVAFPVTSHRFAASRGVSGRLLPYRLTLALESRIPSLLNPLTSFPALAHRQSRTPSPAVPAGAHQMSRKASPHQSESPAR
jgi:hypothetical protein